MLHGSSYTLPSGIIKVNNRGAFGACSCDSRTGWPREISPRLAMKAGYLWAYKGSRAVAAYRRGMARGQLFPPFLFLALTNACNLRCRGCWIAGDGQPASIGRREDVDRLIAAGKRQAAYFYTLLGGEPHALSAPLGPRPPPSGLLFPDHHQRHVLS